MKHLKNFKLFTESDGGGVAAATAAVSGSGDVSNPQPGAFAGDTGTTGSGDVSFYLSNKKRKRIKKGKPNEVSDLRFLEPATGITKLKEGIVYDQKNDYISDIKSKLCEYNIRPLVLTQILDKYSDVIDEYFENGTPVQDFVNMIVDEFELDSGGFGAFNVGSQSWNRTIKYL